MMLAMTAKLVTTPSTPAPSRAPARTCVDTRCQRGSSVLGPGGRKGGRAGTGSGTEGDVRACAAMRHVGIRSASHRRGVNSGLAKGLEVVRRQRREGGRFRRVLVGGGGEGGHAQQCPA